MSFVFSDLGRMPSTADCGVFATPKYLVECSDDGLPPHLDLLLVFVYDHACNYLYTEGIKGTSGPFGVQGNILYFYDGLPFDLESRQRITTAPPFQEPTSIVLPESWKWIGRSRVREAKAFGSCVLVAYENTTSFHRSQGDSITRLYSSDGSIIKEWIESLCESWVEGNTLLLWMGTSEYFEWDDPEDKDHKRSYLHLYKVERV